jgi:hypothetical protein
MPLLGVRLEDLPEVGSSVWKREDPAVLAAEAAAKREAAASARVKKLRINLEGKRKVGVVGRGGAGGHEGCAVLPQRPKWWWGHEACAIHPQLPSGGGCTHTLFMEQRRTSICSREQAAAPYSTPQPLKQRSQAPS